MKDVIPDAAMVAFCGLYCGACRSYLKGRCPGCHENAKATWCGIRTCCREHAYSSCADCKDFDNPKDCKKFNNFISKIIGFITRSDRNACISQIKSEGLEGHAAIMAKQRKQSISK